MTGELGAVFEYVFQLLPQNPPLYIPDSDLGGMSMYVLASDL